jgi:ABC-2 type transport system permease protein
MQEILRAAFVIGRRDFTAIIMSKAFIFFLLGPLFPLVVGVAAGSLGGQMAQEVDKPVIGIMMAKAPAQKLVDTRTQLIKTLGPNWFPDLKILPIQPDKSAENYLTDKANNLSVVISGTFEKPVVTGTGGQASRWNGEIALLSGYAISGDASKLPEIKVNAVKETAGDSKMLRQLTGQGAQTLLFMLTTLLAGMVLSNLVEEKSNKIIEILAASIPIDSVFIGKLFAMLAMACVGIVVWVSVGYGILSIAGAATALPSFPTPAVGWPIFFVLGVVYFTMSYLMLGSLFLGIGAMAATVREVQTLSMPATMLQLIVFFFAVYTGPKLGQTIEQVACIIPFSSPLAMIARAAQEPTLWHHGVAIIGQAFFAVLLLRVGVTMFKRNVMKSGSAGRVDGNQKRKLFGLIPIKG